MKNSSPYYTRTAQMLHWIMAIIFIAAWLIGFYSGNFLSYDVDGSFKGQVISLHKNIATTIIFLVVIRCSGVIHILPLNFQTACQPQ